MCGEHRVGLRRASGELGSSPHVRGAPKEGAYGKAIDGIIPACAGSTATNDYDFDTPRDHPRMCGEHKTGFENAAVELGSSPHVRGAQKHCRHRRGVPGIIPACAGSTASVFDCDKCFWDHPRMCGEHRYGNGGHVENPGSSPHVRGALKARQVR